MRFVGRTGLRPVIAEVSDSVALGNDTQSHGTLRLTILTAYRLRIRPLRLPRNSGRLWSALGQSRYERLCTSTKADDVSYTPEMPIDAIVRLDDIFTIVHEAAT